MGVLYTLLLLGYFHRLHAHRSAGQAASVILYINTD
jgi:hypothetical protein